MDTNWNDLLTEFSYAIIDSIDNAFGSSAYQPTESDYLKIDNARKKLLNKIEEMENKAEIAYTLMDNFITYLEAVTKHLRKDYPSNVQ